MPEANSNNAVLEKRYAESSWTVEDILARFPAATPSSARKFLEEFERTITEAMIEAGWEAIECLGEAARGWEATTDDEEEAFERAREQQESC